MPLRLEAPDGRRLAATTYGTGSHYVLIAGATGVPRTYYARFASWLARQGFGVLTLDYRGIGESAEGPRDPACMSDWGRLDIEAGLLHLRDQGAHRLGVVGHSVAGQVLPLAPHADLMDRLVLVGSQSGAARHWTGMHRLKVMALWYAAIPLLVPVMGRFPSGWFGMGASLPGGVAREWASWGRHRDYIVGRSKEAADRFARFRAPILSLAADDDLSFAPLPAVKALTAWYGSAEKQVVVMPGPIGHFGFFRRQGEPWWPQVADWLRAPQIPQR